MVHRVGRTARRQIARQLLRRLVTVSRTGVVEVGDVGLGIGTDRANRVVLRVVEARQRAPGRGVTRLQRGVVAQHRHHRRGVAGGNGSLHGEQHFRPVLRFGVEQRRRLDGVAGIEFDLGRQQAREARRGRIGSGTRDQSIAEGTRCLEVFQLAGRQRRGVEQAGLLRWRALREVAAGTGLDPLAPHVDTGPRQHPGAG